MAASASVSLQREARMRVFVIGTEGQVARSLREAAASFDDLELACGCRPGLDLLKPASLHAALADFRPDVVINPAAYTAVDRAESEPDLAFAINRDGARAAAVAAAEVGAPIIHLSTDYVFDGRKAGAYVETDPAAPQGVYGRSKLEGELAVIDANPDHIIARTSWVYAPFGNNFVRTMLRLGRSHDRIAVVDDQTGCPTFAADIAVALIEMARRLLDDRDRARYAGIVHLAGPDAMTWHGFAKAIFAGVVARGGKAPTLDPISTADYPTAAVRPVNSRLSTAKLGSTFGIDLPRVTISLGACLRRLLEIEGRLS
jgi:dTDP-4-dehydrorhamnose reductase